MHNYKDMLTDMAEMVVVDVATMTTMADRYRGKKYPYPEGYHAIMCVACFQPGRCC